LEQRTAGLRLNEFAESARQFVWNELADWYLESIKHRLRAQDPDAETARAVLVHVFDAALRLLHPIVPFITETLWQRLPRADAGDNRFLATAGWPQPTGRGDAFEFDRVRETITALRQIRADYNLPPGQLIAARIVAGDTAVFEREREIITRLARTELHAGVNGASGAAAHAVLADGSEVVVPLEGLVDLKRECARLRSELAQLERHLTALEKRLANDRFMSQAPANVVEAERQKQQEWRLRRQQLAKKVEELCAD
jgi:valyl-tRNA synthetase